jgi:hypothetical protein
MTQEFGLSNPMGAVARACVFKQCSSAFDGTAEMSKEPQIVIGTPLDEKDPLLKKAEHNWSIISQRIPVDLQDHTTKNAMGTTNHGTLFKAVLLVLRNGCLIRSCQTIVISEQALNIGMTRWLRSARGLARVRQAWLP